MKKKFLSFVLALCLIVPGIALLSACNNNSPVGTYKVSTLTMIVEGETEPQTFTVEDYNTMKQQYEQNPPENIEDEFLLSNLEIFFNTKLTIYEDGNFVINYLGYLQAGTWALSGDTFITIIATEDDEHVERLTYSNNTITNIDGDTKVVFVKNA